MSQDQDQLIFVGLNDCIRCHLLLKHQNRCIILNFERLKNKMKKKIEKKLEKKIEKKKLIFGKNINRRQIGGQKIPKK